MIAGALRTPYAGRGGGNWLAYNLRARWEGEGGPYRVNAFRCPSCGSVEFAATERPVEPGCMGVLLLLTGIVVGMCWLAGRVLAG